MIQRIPFPISTVWIFTLPIYLLLLSQQSSHLGNWPKPNELSDLLASYSDSILILTILIPIIATLIIIKSKRNIETQLIEETGCSRSIMITSLLWFSVPLLFWILSHLTSLNLFVDRYFIPKETAIIFLAAYGLSFILLKLPQQKSKNISIFSTLALAIMLLVIRTKRYAFGLNKDTNYHHSLIIEESYPKSQQPIVLEGDPEYFSNAYLARNECLFAVENEPLIELYKRFSNKIKFLE